jgi:5-methylcytosine-specific restriction endonuclease McrA
MTVPLFPEDQERERQDQEKERLSKIYGTPEFRQAYCQYINSYAWKKLCAQVRKRARGRCERCERCDTLPIRLEVHHLTYERFQNELLSDLEALCPTCHTNADQEREIKNHEEFEAAGQEARYESARHTYLSKKYGENYFMHCSHFEDEEFDDWFQRKMENNW